MVKPPCDEKTTELLKAVPTPTHEPWKLAPRVLEELRADRLLPGVNKNDR